MDHTATLRHIADTYFLASLEMSFDSLLAPIDDVRPAGIAMCDTPVYHALRRARSADDPSLPMGAWAHELKRADWPAVSQGTAELLRHRSKDLQCVAWLLEARLHLDGFTAIAPCLTLLDALLRQYWDAIHPQADGGNLEQRANVISWIGEKLLPALRLTPITDHADNRASTQYSWSDQEQAQRNAQIKARAGSGQQEIEGTTLDLFQQGVTASSTGYYQQLQRTLADALQALKVLDERLDTCFGSAAPSMAAMASLLAQLLAFAEGELHRRGALSVPAESERPAAGPAEVAPVVDTSTPASALPHPLAGPIRDREDAYARLAELSEYLMRIEPHSPSPYLLRRAVQWGRLDTAELYQEIFIRSNGMLSIFEVLGLEVPDNGQNP